MVTEPELARQFLADHGLSQADIAREMGNHRQTLNRYLNGERTPPEGFWARFEEAGDKLRKSLLAINRPTPLNSVLRNLSPPPRVLLAEGGIT